MGREDVWAGGVRGHEPDTCSYLTLKVKKRGWVTEKQRFIVVVYELLEPELLEAPKSHAGSSLFPADILTRQHLINNHLRKKNTKKKNNNSKFLQKQWKLLARTELEINIVTDNFVMAVNL